MGVGTSKLVSLPAAHLGALIVLAQATRMQERGQGPGGPPQSMGGLELESCLPPGTQRKWGSGVDPQNWTQPDTTT